MTVVNPKSISGITSITTASGSDNLLTIHTSDANNTERFRIDSTGATKIVTGIVTNLTANAVNIGIDTGVYGEDLVVTGNSRVTGITTFGDSDNPALMLNIDATSGLPAISIPDSIIHSGDTNTKIRFPAADTITAETGGSERVRITSAGLMGIGTNSPDNILHLESSSNPYLQLEKVGTSSKIYLGNASGEAVLEATAGAIKLKPNGASNKFILDTSGNLILGAASYQNGGFGGSSHGINIAGTQPQILLHETDTDKDGYFGLASSILRIQTADSIPVTIWTNDTKRINVHETTGDTTLETGNLVIGTSGKGIDFSAGADSASTSNLLDEYEEGEYTPALSTGQTLNSSYDRLRYTKIGRQVSITGQLVFSAYNSGNFSSTFTIGLPFNNGDGGDRSEYLYHAGIAYFNPSGSSSPNNGYQPIGFYAAANSSHVSVFAIEPNTDTTIGNWVGSGSDVWVNLTYFTD